MVLHSLNLKRGPFDDVLMGEMSVADMRHFTPSRITDEVYESICRTPELDRRYRGRMMTPVIVVIHHQGHGGGYGGMPSMGAFSHAHEIEMELSRQRTYYEGKIKMLQQQLLTPGECFKIAPETNTNLLLTI